MNDLLAQLSSTRPIFYSEADLQHSLAWQLHLSDPALEIHLEYPTMINGKVAYIDILARGRRGVTAIELKYKTRLAKVGHNGESYALRDQGAQDHGGYDFLKDIERLESYVAKTHTKRYAILVTNDPRYWVSPRTQNTYDAQFRLYEDRLLAKSLKLKWTGHPSPGTIAGRHAPIVLQHAYTLRWREYSRFDNVKYGRFRCLVIQVLPARTGN